MPRQMLRRTAPEAKADAQADAEAALEAESDEEAAAKAKADEEATAQAKADEEAAVDWGGADTDAAANDDQEASANAKADEEAAAEARAHAEVDEETAATINVEEQAAAEAKRSADDPTPPPRKRHCAESQRAVWKQASSRYGERWGHENIGRGKPPGTGSSARNAKRTEQRRKAAARSSLPS